MTKSNVNPNHYKVAGRDRQGEGILQERHKQKHAQSVARKRFEQTTLSRATPGPAGAPVPAPAPARPSAASEEPPTPAKRATPPKPTGRKPASTARRKTTAAVTKKAPEARASTGAKTSAKKRAAPRAATRAAGSAQASDKRGKRSTAQKRASSRNDFDSMPATRPVGGAFGKEPSARRRATRSGRT